MKLNPFAFIGRWHRKHLRNIDRAYLFPMIREHQKSEIHGTKAIMAHIEHDYPWSKYPEEWRWEVIELSE